MKWRKDEVRQCGCCGRWTCDGDAVPSGNRDPRTGQTPMDNFICDRCQEDARVLREASLTCDAWAKHREAA